MTERRLAELEYNSGQRGLTEAEADELFAVVRPVVESRVVHSPLRAGGPGVPGLAPGSREGAV